MNLFDLAAKLTLDSGEFDKGVSDASEKGQNLGSKLASALGTGAKVAGAAVAAVGSAAVAAGTAMVKAAGETAAYGDNIDKMSQKLGLSAEAYQEWDFIMQHSGTTIEGMSRGMTTLNKAAESGSDAFSKLGISQEEVASLNQEQLFARTIEALQGMEAGSERAVLAQELLGGAAKELGPLLNTSAEDTEAMRQQVHELGGVMSDEAVKAAAAYQDSLQNMQTAFSGLQRGLTSEFMPGITTVMDGLTAIFSGDSDSGLGMISEGISNIVSGISDQIPKLVQLASGIVTSLLTAITQNLPTLMSAGVDMVMQIADGVLQNLPEIVKAGLDVILTLASSISDSIPELLPTIIDVVLQIVDTLVQNAPLLLDAALQLIIGLADGIIESLPELIDRIPEIVASMVVALIEAAPMLLEAALELIVSLGRFIVISIPKLIEMLPQVVQSIVTKLIQEAPRLIESAKEMINRLMEGIRNKFGDIAEKGREVFNQFKEAISNKASELLNVGYNLVVGIWNGISDAAGWLWDQIAGFASGIVSKFKAFLGIRSPSRVMRDQVGKNIGLGVAEGIEDTIPDVEQASKDMAEASTGTLVYEADKDYTALMLKAKDYEEFIKLAALRQAKIIGENIDITAKNWRTSEQIFSEWKSSLNELTYDAKVDYTALIQQAKSYEEALNYAKLREAKIIGEGIDVTAKGWKTTESILSEWKTASGGLVYDAKTDYTALILSAKTAEEAMEYAKLREAKIVGEGINIAANGWKTTEQILNEWKAVSEGLVYDAKTDYTALILAAKTAEEAMKYAKLREAKIIGESIDIAANGWKTTEQILSEWETASKKMVYNAKTDYTALILAAQTAEEAMKYAKLREAKIIGEGIDVVAKGWKTTEQILKEWETATKKVGAAAESEVAKAVKKASKKASDLVSTVQDQMTAAENVVKNSEKNFRAAGKTLVMQIADGIKDGRGYLARSVQSAMAEALSSAGIESATSYDTKAIPISPINAAQNILAKTSQARTDNAKNIKIEFTGDLAQLGRLLQPVITAEGVRIGGNLVTA